MTAILTASWPALYAADKADRLDVTVVRISRGCPRYWPAAARFPSMPELMPNSWMFGLEGDAFFRAYTRRLDQRGLPAIMAALEAIPGDKPLAIACFEPFGGPPCHRHEFSRWFEKQTGDRIEEWQPEPVLAAQLQFDVQPAPLAPEGM